MEHLVHFTPKVDPSIYQKWSEIWPTFTLILALFFGNVMKIGSRKETGLIYLPTFRFQKGSCIYQRGWKWDPFSRHTTNTSCHEWTTSLWCNYNVMSFASTHSTRMLKWCKRLVCTFDYTPFKVTWYTTYKFNVGSLCAMFKIICVSSYNTYCTIYKSSNSFGYG